VRDIAASHLTPPVKVDLDEFAKSEIKFFMHLVFGILYKVLWRTTTY
jgi:hypothetical protein